MPCKCKLWPHDYRGWHPPKQPSSALNRHMHRKTRQHWNNESPAANRKYENRWPLLMFCFHLWGGFSLWPWPNPRKRSPKKKKNFAPRYEILSLASLKGPPSQTGLRPLRGVETLVCEGGPKTVKTKIRTQKSKDAFFPGRLSTHKPEIIK
jgi:hypothetical protein